MKRYLCIILGFIFVVGLAAACQDKSTPSANEKKSIVVTYSILASVVKDLVGDMAEVTVSVPNGLDIHEWEPSAKDIEAINKADLVIQNGLDLEAGMEKTLTAARNNGVSFFTASDYIDVRYVGAEEGVHDDEDDNSGDHQHEAGAPDPHLWTDPLAMKSIVSALAVEIEKTLDIDVKEQAADMENRLTDLNKTVSDILAVIPENDRKLVTGHESMGYFARRYGFTMIGVIIPSLSSQAGVSAADLAALKSAIEENNVQTIFTEVGTSPAVATTISKETGVKVVELATHILPDDGSYFTFMTDISNVIANALK